MKLYFLSQTAVVEEEVVIGWLCDNEKPLWNVVIEVGKERGWEGYSSACGPVPRLVGVTLNHLLDFKITVFLNARPK